MSINLDNSFIADTLSCSVCLDGYNESNQKAVNLHPCNHKLCLKCALDMFKEIENDRVKNVEPCPLCQKEITYYAVDHTLNEIVQKILKAKNLKPISVSSSSSSSSSSSIALTNPPLQTENISQAANGSIKTRVQQFLQPLQFKTSSIFSYFLPNISSSSSVSSNKEPKEFKENKATSKKSQFDDKLTKVKTGSDGYIYKGSFNKFGQLHGQGKVMKPDGTLFQEGQFENQILIVGKEIGSNGFIYEGSFNELGQLHGPGKITRLDGSLYKEGLFINRKLTEGRVINQDTGVILEGTFNSSDALHGQGKIWNVDGTLLEEGEYENGTLKL